eukprot:6049657-Heterocapsa_arctica.AAC.1
MLKLLVGRLAGRSCCSPCSMCCSTKSQRKASGQGPVPSTILGPSLVGLHLRKGYVRVLGWRGWVVGLVGVTVWRPKWGGGRGEIQQVVVVGLGRP